MSEGPIQTNDRGTLATRVLADGRVLDLHPLTLGRVRLVISPDLASDGYDDGY